MRKRRSGVPRRALVLALLLPVLPAGGLAPGAAQTELAERVVIASAEPCLNLHSEPDSKSALVRCLAPGRRMNLLESKDGWARVRLADAAEGWVLFRLVRPAISTPDGGESVESRQIVKLESALAAAAVERTELKRGTSVLRGEIYDLRIANEKLTALAGERSDAAARAEQQIGELEAAVARANSQSEAATAEVERLRERLAGLESAALDREAQVEDLAGRLEAAEKLLADAEARRLESVRELEVLWREETALRKRAESERAQPSQASQADAALRAEVEQLRAENERLESEVRAVESDRIEAGRRISELEATLALAEAGGPELEAADLEELSGSRLDLLEEALGAAEAERRQLEREFLELQREITRLEDANEWLAMAAVERPQLVSVAAAGPREYGGAQDPYAEPVAPPMLEPAESVEQVEPYRSSEPQPSEPSQPAADLAEPAAETPEASVPAEAPLPRAEPAAPPVSGIEARDATAAVEAWARAWSEQRVEDYLYFYSSAFEPADSSSREEWEALRRERVSGPEWIEVRIALADLEPLGDGRMAVVFLQSYESNLMTDVVLKTLELIREDGGWKIVAERVE